MPLKRYYSRRYPELRLGSTIKFSGGYYQTDIDLEQSQIEHSDLFGGLIREIPAPKGVAMPIMESQSDDRSLFSSLLVDDVDLDDDPRPQLAEKSPEHVQEVKPFNLKTITATDLQKLRRKDLDFVARELGVDTTGNMIKVKHRVRQKLGV